MSQAIVTLKHPTITSDVAVRVICDQVNVSGRKNIIAKPNANVSGPVEAQTQSFENLKIAVQGIRFTEEAGTLTRANVMSMYQAKYDGTAAGAAGNLILNVTYGPSVASRDIAATTLQTLKGNEDSADIKVVMESFSLPISARETTDGYLPIGNIILTETA